MLVAEGTTGQTVDGGTIDQTVDGGTTGQILGLAVLQVRVMDGEPEASFFFKGDKLYPKRLLGEAELPLARIQVH